MPMVGGAARGGRGPSRSQQLAAKAPKKQIRPVLGIRYYYRSAEMLLRQADSYRAQRNEDELYVMLMRFVSLVIETIPQHGDHRGGVDPQYQTLKRKAVDLMGELEGLKISLDTKGPSAALLPRPAQKDVIRVTTSMLPEADWTLLRPPTSALSRGNSLQQQQPRQQQLQQPLQQQLLQPLPPPGAPRGDPFALPGLDGFDGLPSVPSSHPLGAPGPPGPGALTMELPPDLLLATPSAQAIERHSLVGQIGGPGPPRAAAAPWNPVQQHPGQQLQPGGLYSISVEDSSPVNLPQDKPQFQDPLVQELQTMQVQPSAPLIQQPQLGPQMVDVIDMVPPSSALTNGPSPADNCSSCPPGGGDIAVVQSPEKPKEKVGIKDVHVSVALMEEFMRYASSNTRKGIESCGILAGKLDAETNIFTITTLIIPHQEGTRDTVTALNEEDIFMAQDERGLFPLGWIHTHPTQTCFLSSVDVHTQCGYQTLLDEAVAIVMAPTDRSKRCGIFRLSTPGGLKLIQRCSQRGFHSHPETETRQPIYELCGHVYLNPRIKMDTIDLRK